jgi:hypothetical protein
MTQRTCWWPLPIFFFRCNNNYGLKLFNPALIFVEEWNWLCGNVTTVAHLFLLKFRAKIAYAPTAAAIYTAVETAPSLMKI